MEEQSQKPNESYSLKISDRGTQKNLMFHTSALKKKMRDAKIGKLMEKDKRILEELRSLHCDPHPYFTILPSESDFSKWHGFYYKY